MRDCGDLLVVIRKAALDAVSASKPTGVVFGKVVSSNPLAIKIDQKLTLTKGQLVLTGNVTSYKAKILTDWETEEYDRHSHNIKGMKSVTIHNQLQVGEDVIMVQMQGGQKFIVLDRVVL